MNHNRSSTQRLEMQAGQSQALCLPAGTQVRVHRGSLLLTEPALWLGETMHRLSRRLHSGESHVLTQHGWLQLQASRGLTVVELHNTAVPAAAAPRRPVEHAATPVDSAPHAHGHAH
ncbi:hypothetical protein [Aquabacterium sp.]|uniref:hypothetical protein n=1 Tax=Aquabacterium sp. TaxID=1872578 RepID=UPI002B63CB03|nr:hypothetical protein [Aquabacterium sp.]HSW03731.1 hypothetical protein [Aquabacterium sp.]